MSITRKVIEIAEELIEIKPELTLAQALPVAAQIANIETLKEAFLLNSQDSPSALEAIAMQLGYEGLGKMNRSVSEAIGDVATAISDNKQ